MKILLFAILFLMIPALLFPQDPPDIILLSPSMVEVKFAWDPSTSSQVAGYALISRNFEKYYSDPPLMSGEISQDPNPEIITFIVQDQWKEAEYIGIENLHTGKAEVPNDRQSAFVCIAFGWTNPTVGLLNSGMFHIIFSGYSNEVIFTPDDKVDAPSISIKK